ncbi:hypothetical protein BDK92_2225 [Micromonospora pisi]|uniref:Uncharacterized protein n=1 Tax=Micromonospora pisi TaxID=589240 RepID=A0A495JHV7_9ACTN|nr:hypothetical protein [Micromonospora pisi]RKR87922.1 hypothetical protein BDK92_2225 [Micromonospora pisi]
MTLEQTYRRLLACYPWEHRQQYEEEMLGVLLDDAGPQQRHPRARDVLDLLSGALRTRTRYALTNLSGQPWREAAAVLGLLAPLALFAYAGRLVLLNLTVAATRGYLAEFSALLTWRSWAPVAVWLMVVILAATGWHRTAASLAWAGTALQAVPEAGDYGNYQSVSSSWTVALAVVAAVALTVAAPRSGATSLGRRWLVPLAGAALLVGAPTITAIVLPNLWTGNLRTPWIFTNNVTYLEALLLGVGYALGALTVLLTPAPLRRRLLALLAPVGATLLITRIGFGDRGFLARTSNGEIPTGLNLAQWLALVLIPPLTLAVAVAVVHRRERSLRVPALSRVVDRQPPSAEPGPAS